MKRLENLTDYEIGYVFNEIIDDMSKNDDIPVKALFTIVADEYNITEKKVKYYLVKYGSKFVRHKNNPTEVIGYIDNKPLKFTTHHVRMYKIFKKVRNNLVKNNDDFDEKDISIIDNEIKKQYRNIYRLEK